MDIQQGKGGGNMPSKSKAWIWIVIIIIVAIAVGLCTWWYMTKQIDSKQGELDDLNTKTDNLEKQVADLQKDETEEAAVESGEEVVSANTEETSVKEGWTIYTNDKYGFSLSYPDTWFADTKEKNPDFSNFPGTDKPGFNQLLWLTTHEDIPSFQEGDLGEGDEVRLGLNYMKNSDNMTLEEWMDHRAPQDQSDFVDNPPENIESSWIKIDGLDAHRYIYYPGNKWGSDGVYTMIQLDNGDFIDMDGMVTHEGYFDTYLEKIIEVEDSFKSLD